MEQRHITGKSHWYHETQSSTAEYDVLPLVPEAAKVSDPFLLDVILDEETLAPFLSWLVPARVLAEAAHEKRESVSNKIRKLKTFALQLRQLFYVCQFRLHLYVLKIFTSSRI